MRLLNAFTLELENFRQDAPPVRKIPRYAILSHTWEGDEVTFDDFQQDTATSKPTWKKVWSACQRTRKDGLEYIWIDSCCIDKSNFVEFDEALNSMYAYYEEAAVCYTYLADVPAVCDPNQPGSAFERSRWFTRGWTLQELIAPAEVLFFSQDWTELGCKNMLCGILSEITRIDEDILMHRRRVQSASVAKRMSWAAHRKTTRPEDIAYCLVGIFSIRMSSIYGEGGEGAFLRLQEHIMKQSYDHSIFAWVDLEAPKDSLHGMLTTSPSKFADCHNIFPHQEWTKHEYSMTNLGLQIELPMIAKGRGEFIAMLGCVRLQHSSISYMGIILKRISQDRKQYARIKLNRLEEVSEKGAMQAILVPQSNSLPGLEGFSMNRAFELRQMPGSPYQVTSVLAQAGTDLTLSKAELPRTFEIDKGSDNHLQCCITIEQKRGPSLLLMLGTMEESAVGFDAIDAHDPSIFDIDDFETIRDLYSPVEFGNWLKIQNHFVRMEAEIQVCRSHKYYVVDVKIHPVSAQQSWDKPSLAYLNSRPALRPRRPLSRMSAFAYHRWMVLMVVTIAMMLVALTRFGSREGSTESHDVL